jgi:hypothetical protein
LILRLWHQCNEIKVVFEHIEPIAHKISVSNIDRVLCKSQSYSSCTTSYSPL